MSNKIFFFFFFFFALDSCVTRIARNVTRKWLVNYMLQPSIADLFHEELALVPSHIGVTRGTYEEPPRNLRVSHE